MKWLAIGSWQRPIESNHWNSSSYNYTRSSWRIQHQPFCSSSAFEPNWEGQKAHKWVPRKLTKNKTSRCFEGSSSLTLCNDHFLIGLSCAMKSGFYMIAGDNHLSGGTEKKLQSTSQNQTSTPKKVMVTLWWSAAHLIHYSFLNPGKIIISEKHVQQINERLQKLQHLQSASVNRKAPILHNITQPHVTQPMLHKLNELGYKVLPHLPYSPDCLPTDHHFKHLDNFCREKSIHNQQQQKMLSKNLLNPKVWIFMLQE